jgi:hypothetical protein
MRDILLAISVWILILLVLSQFVNWLGRMLMRKPKLPGEDEYFATRLECGDEGGFWCDRCQHFYRGENQCPTHGLWP